MPVDLLFPQLVVVFKIIFLFCFFLKCSCRFNFPPNKRGRFAAGSVVGHAFSRQKTTRVTAHMLIYVSQCKMRHSNPVPQHEFFSAPFPVLPLFVRHSCFACLLPLSIALFDVELCFFVACFLDLFLSPFLCLICL